MSETERDDVRSGISLCHSEPCAEGRENLASPSCHSEPCAEGRENLVGRRGVKNNAR